MDLEQYIALMKTEMIGMILEVMPRVAPILVLLLAAAILFRWLNLAVKLETPEEWKKRKSHEALEDAMEADHLHDEVERETRRRGRGSRVDSFFD